MKGQGLRVTLTVKILSQIRLYSVHKVFGRPFVKRFALCYRSVVCPVCPVLSVTFVHCGETVGGIKMKPGMQVGLGPGHIVLGGDPANLECRSEMCCTRLAANTGRKKVAKNRHMGTIAQLCRAISLPISATAELLLYEFNECPLVLIL